MFSNLRYRLRALFRRNSMEAELDAELRAHVEQQAEKYVQAGMSPEEAARRVRLEFGGIEQVKEEVRASWGVRLVSELGQDVRYGVRALRRDRKFTLFAIVSLGFAIGLNTAVFSFVDSVLLRPFPFKDPSRLALIWGTRSVDVRRGMSGELVKVWRERSGTLENIAAFQINPFPFALDPDRSDVVQGAMVGPRTFSVLGVQPLLGRTFSEAQESSNAGETVILSYGLWQAHFAGSPRVIGKIISLNGHPYTVIGVMPRGFLFPDQWAHLWVPLTSSSGVSDQVQAVARLRPGMNIKRVQAELDTLQKEDLERSAEGPPIPPPGVFPLYQVVVGPYESALALLLGATGLLVLIGCANVSNLQMARGVGRASELAVRSSLGASRGRIIRLLLVESAILSLAAGAVGVACTWAAVPLFVGLRLTDIPRFGSASVNLHVLAFALVISVAASLASGLIPALRASRSPINSALQAGSQSTAPRRVGELRNLLVAVEVAIALVLLNGSSLLTDSFLRMVHADWGFNPAHVLVVEAPLSSSRPADVSAARIQYVNDVLERLSTIPGVTSDAAAYGVPILYGYWSTQFAVRDRMESWGADTWFVSPGYFRTLGIPVLRGRAFGRGDSEHGPPSVIVNKAFADKLWPGRDPIGRDIQPLKLKKSLAERRAKDPRGALPPEILARADSWEPDGGPREVVGEVGDVREFSLNLVPRPDLYVDYTQATRLCCGEKFVLRVSGNPREIIPSVRSAVLTVDPHVTNLKVSALSELVNASIGGRGSSKLLLVISMLFGGLSFLLTFTGIYGVVSFAVAQRTREIGVRVALGAQRAHIFAMVIGQALRPVILGLLLGLAGAIATSGLLERFLFGVRPTDPSMLLVVGFSLAAAAGTACLPPVFRALRINPSDALRYE